MRQRSAAFDRVAEELIRRSVARLEDAGQAGAALDAACIRIEAAMASMVGAAGYRALLERALHITRREGPDPHLPLALTRSGSGESWISTVSRIGTANATTCASLLFANVLELLASFIGDDLTFRLIRRAFQDFDDSGSEGGQEP